MKYLIVVDMQNDFVDGSLGTPEAQAIVGRVAEKIRSFDGEVLATQDTHGADYLDTQEGKNLPVTHCVEGTEGWMLHPDIRAALSEKSRGEAAAVAKPTFGSHALGETLLAAHKSEPIEEIVLVGLCTDICVISNALLLKAFLPEAQITVDAACCAGVTPQSHATALAAMRPCQIQIENWEG